MKMMQLVCGLVSVVVLVSCTHVQPPATPVPEPVQAPPPAIEVPAVVEVAPRPLMLITPEQSVSAMTRAHQQSLIRPGPQDFRGAVAHLPYHEHMVYALRLVGRQPLVLMFAPGELAEPLITDDWWLVKSAESGEGIARRSVITILALNDGPQTSAATVITNKRVYLLKLSSVPKGAALQAVTWVYPEAPKVNTLTWPAGLYHTDYTMTPESGGPVWKPLRVWTIPHLAKTIILYPEAKLSHRAPMLYALGPDGTTRQIVNRRDKGRYCEVDEVLDHAELRVGHDPASSEVVMIKGPAKRSLWCPSSPDCPLPTGEAQVSR